MPRRLLPLVFAVLLLVAPAAEAKRGPKLTVMTRNVYLGGNIAGPIPAPTRDEFEQKATALWQAVAATDFPARARLLAREVKRTKPDVIGMQEVALWRRGADGVKDGTTTPATAVVYDFLASLRSELKRAGQRYRVGSAQTEADLEAPVSLGYDVRLTMRDVVLVRVRKGLKIRRRLGANYAAVLEVPTAIGTLASRRGWAAADLSLAGRRFRIVDTHLEAFSDDHRLRQARELLGAGGPVRSRQRVIVTGDINSDPVDHVFTKGRLPVLGGLVVGNDPANRTASGLWPSDHGGAVMTLRLR